MPFPYEYPRVRDRGGSSVPTFARGYLIRAPGGSAFPITGLVVAGVAAAGMLSVLLSTGACNLVAND